MGEQHHDLAAAWLGLDPTRLAHERLAAAHAGAVVSHASAAALQGLGDLDADRHEFTLPVRKQSRRPDVRLHRDAVAPEDVTRHDGLPVTAPARTIADLLADHRDGGHVAGVLADAVRARVVDLDELAVRVGGHAARYGLAQGDGKALVRYLLDLGGATEQADADEIAEIARTHRVPVGDLVAGLGAALADAAATQAQMKPVHDAIAAALERMLDPHREQMAAVNAALAEMAPAKMAVPEIKVPAVTIAAADEMAAILSKQLPSAASLAHNQAIARAAAAAVAMAYDGVRRPVSATDGENTSDVPGTAREADAEHD